LRRAGWLINCTSETQSQQQIETGALQARVGGFDMTDEALRHDCALQLSEGLAAGRFSRRQFTLGMAMLGLAAPSAASAQRPTEIVVVNFGGDAIRATNQAYVEPFQRETPGVRVRVDGSGPTSGRMRAIVESGRISWDIVDRNFHGSLELGPLGLLEEIDYTIVDRTKVIDGYAGRWGIGSYTYANVLTYDTRAFGGRVPTTWADFWNIREFPGKRTLRRHIDGVLEAALLADGVPADQIYPIDVNRAFEKLREIKEHTIFWGNHTESYQLLRDREVTMGCLASSRAIPLVRDTRGAVAFTYNQASFFVSGWAVLKGAPAGRRAFEFIASTQDPRRQIEFQRLLGLGPANPAANAIMPADLVEQNPSNPANLARMVRADNAWYAEHSSETLRRFLDEVIA
jgi:putative spermidine/putrescine transport system substrate-binding protein